MASNIITLVFGWAFHLQAVIIWNVHVELKCACLTKYLITHSLLSRLLYHNVLCKTVFSLDTNDKVVDYLCASPEPQAVPSYVLILHFPQLIFKRLPQSPLYLGLFRDCNLRPLSFPPAVFPHTPVSTLFWKHLGYITKDFNSKSSGHPEDKACLQPKTLEGYCFSILSWYPYVKSVFEIAYD